MTTQDTTSTGHSAVATRAVIDRDGQALDVRAQAFGDLDGVAPGGLGEQEHELLAAEPAGAVVIAGPVGQGLGHGLHDVDPPLRGAEALDVVRRLDFADAPVGLVVVAEAGVGTIAAGVAKAYADIVLPVASAWEREGLRVGFGLDRDACELVQLRPAVVAPRGEARADIDIVFEHPGRQTMGASVFACKRAGTIVTCAATSGYMIEYDNRHLWMKLKTIRGSHFANYREAWQANRLVSKGMIHPTMSVVYPLEQTGQAALDVHQNLHHGKVGILCLAPQEGLGVRDHELRDKHLTEINRFRDV